MKLIAEIAIGIFAGYCCCYFISMKTVEMTPEEVVKEYLKIIETKIKRN